MKEDARRYRRVRLQAPVEVTVNTVDHYTGTLINISPGDLAVLADADVTPGDAAVMRIQDLDVIEGTIARTFPDGFAMSFILSKKRRTQLTEALMLRMNGKFDEGLKDRRSSPRHRIPPTRTVCRLSDGGALYATMIDSSVDGAALASSRRPPIGSDIHVGRRRAVVIRHTPRGFVVVYEAISGEKETKLRAV